MTVYKYENIHASNEITHIRQKYYFAAILSLLSGFLIYIFFRNHNVLIFRIFLKPSFLESIYFPAVSDSIFISMFLFNLPDGLWFLSGLLIIRAVWITNPKWRLIYFLIFSFAALFMEISQIYNTVPGTFDFLDIVFMMLFAITEYFIFIKYSKRSIL